jgi:hypothetical protein
MAAQVAITPPAGYGERGVDTRSANQKTHLTMAAQVVAMTPLARLLDMVGVA